MFSIFKRKESKEKSYQEESVETVKASTDEITEDAEFAEEYEDENNDKGEPKEKVSAFKRWSLGLSKTRNNFISKIGNLLSRKTKIDPELLDEMEEILIQADIGVETTMQIMSNVRQRVKQEKLESTPEIIIQLLKDEMLAVLGKEKQVINIDQHKPFVMVVLGVNGTGKTTTIAKMAAKFRKQNKKVILAAGDTFRAAAVDQLEIWSQRVGGLDLIKHQEGSDPAAVAFDAIQAAVARGADIVIIDTAGRLHTKKNLMEELKKIKRVCDRALPGAPHEVLLVLDATTGQNALSQVKQFKEAVEVTGIALTKLDGTAKGGIIIAIKNEFGIPVKLVGIGEKLSDLEDFSPVDFVNALFE
ncbi:MAG: signal recognition particle-docking protein FtsY [bacterium]